MSTQRVAFVGCGGIAEHYLEAYRDLAWVETVVCIDAVLDRAALAARRIGESSHPKLAPRASVSFADALGSEVDTIVINTPNHLHCEQAVAALAAGKNLLLQKPVAATLGEAVKIAEAAESAARRGCVSGLYLSYFDQPLMHDLRDMVRAGWFGELSHLYARLMHRGGLALSRRVRDGQQDWRASAAQTGGGCFIQLAVHYIHLFVWFMDSPVSRVTAVVKNLHSPGVEGEDLACAILEFENGVMATIDTAWCAAGEELSLRGTRGTAQYTHNRSLSLDSNVGEYAGRVVRYTGTGTGIAPGAPGATTAQQIITVEAPRLGDVSNPYNQHQLFLAAARDKRPAPVSIASGVDDMRVVAAVYEAARTNRSVAVRNFS